MKHYDAYRQDTRFFPKHVPFPDGIKGIYYLKLLAGIGRGTSADLMKDFMQIAKIENCVLLFNSVFGANSFYHMLGIEEFESGWFMYYGG